MENIQGGFGHSPIILRLFCFVVVVVVVDVDVVFIVVFVPDIYIVV